MWWAQWFLGTQTVVVFYSAILNPWILFASYLTLKMAAGAPANTSTIQMGRKKARKQKRQILLSFLLKRLPDKLIEMSIYISLVT